MKSKRLRAITAKRNIIPAKQEPVIICSDIEKLSFAKFLKCLTTNNLSELIESGNPEPNQLFIAWISILSAYYALIKSKDQLKYIKLCAKMEALLLRITVVGAICESLRLWYEPKLCDCLKKLGYKYAFTEETFLNDLNIVMNEIGSDGVQLEKYRNQYNAEHKVKKTKGEAPTKDSYMRILYAIEKFRQQRYPPDKITVYEFGSWYLELMEYGEAMKAQQDNSTYNKKRHGK